MLFRDKKPESRPSPYDEWFTDYSLGDIVTMIIALVVLAILIYTKS